MTGNLGSNSLYQLTWAEGETTYNPHGTSRPEYVSNYTQSFTFDRAGLGNMTQKMSGETVRPHRKLGDGLGYGFDYEYDSENYAHRLVKAGDRYYAYDANGNIVLEQDGEIAGAGKDGRSHKINEEDENVYSTDYGWGLLRDTRANGNRRDHYSRTYGWNSRNQLVSTSDSRYTVNYIYGADGQRAVKYTQDSETLYYNKMWSHHTDGGNSHLGGHNIKNIYLGETRIVTKLAAGGERTIHEEYYKQFYYHSDHLGSAALITDYRGDEYQRIEYTPYGEIWVEEQRVKNEALVYLPYKFTGKERDEETGLYYYGARYLDAKYSHWMSTDPALGDYIPKAPINDEAKKQNQNLPGMGGVFNTVNLNLYHYAGNNPIKYTDPDGKQACPSEIEEIGEGIHLVTEGAKNPATQGIIAAIAVKVLAPLFIVGFVFCISGDTISAPLPPGYNKDNYGNILAPNGSLIATPSQAWKHAEGKPDWAIVEGWGKGTFSDSNESLLYHFDKHGKEVGANNIQQYLNKAEGFKNNLKNAKKTPSKNPLTGEYNATRYEKNGKFIILDNETKDILSFGKVTE